MTNSGGGVENCLKLRDVIYGWSLIHLKFSNLDWPLWYDVQLMFTTCLICRPQPYDMSRQFHIPSVIGHVIGSTSTTTTTPKSTTDGPTPKKSQQVIIPSYFKQCKNTRKWLFWHNNNNDHFKKNLVIGFVFSLMSPLLKAVS